MDSKQYLPQQPKEPEVPTITFTPEQASTLLDIIGHSQAGLSEIRAERVKEAPGSLDVAFCDEQLAAGERIAEAIRVANQASNSHPGVSTASDFRHPTAAQFAGGLYADGYDHAVDPGVLRTIGALLPGWLILALRPSFTLGAPRSAWRAGVAAWRLGFALGRSEVVGFNVAIRPRSPFRTPAIVH